MPQADEHPDNQGHQRRGVIETGPALSSLSILGWSTVKVLLPLITAGPFADKQKALLPFVYTGSRAFLIAVTVGFEPTLAFTPNNISSVAPSAARTRHQPE